MTKPIYKLHKPINTKRNNVEYLIIATKDGKSYGYVKRTSFPQAEYQPQPRKCNYGTLRFVGYISEETFNEMVFIDLL